ncbi:Zn finger-containing GTPase- Activating Protein for ARF [Conglomerata obtusa]
MNYNTKIKKLSQTHDNRTCMDCNSPNPHWCSISLGIFICLECASQHRSYGVRVSKVRSINMDSWTEAMYKIMQNGGNKKFREYMQAGGVNMDDKHEMYMGDVVRRYRVQLCGPDVEMDARPFQSVERREERKEKDVSTYEWLSGYVCDKARFVKEKGMDFGSRFNESVIGPATNVVKEKAAYLHGKWNNKKEPLQEGNVEIKPAEECKSKKINFSKWD